MTKQIKDESVAVFLFNLYLEILGIVSSCMTQSMNKLRNNTTRGQHILAMKLLHKIVVILSSKQRLF